MPHRNLKLDGYVNGLMLSIAYSEYSLSPVKPLNKQNCFSNCLISLYAHKTLSMEDKSKQTNKGFGSYKNSVLTVEIWIFFGHINHFFWI